MASAAYSYGRSRILEVIDVSWDYLCYVRKHPISWAVPTHILYGSEDNLTSFEIIQDFAEKHNAVLTVKVPGDKVDEYQKLFTGEGKLNGKVEAA